MTAEFSWVLEASDVCMSVNNLMSQTHFRIHVGLACKTSVNHVRQSESRIQNLL